MKLHELFEDQNGDQDLIDILRKHCPNNLKAMASGRAPMLWRGMNWDASIETPKYKCDTVSTQKTKRESKTGSNLIMSFFSTNKDWVESTVNRSLSTSTSCSYDYASQFSGPTWLVIPFDNVKRFSYTYTDLNLVDVNDTSLIDLNHQMKDISNAIEGFRHWNYDKLDKDIARIAHADIFDYDIGSHHYSTEEIKEFSNQLEKIFVLLKNTKKRKTLAVTDAATFKDMEEEMNDSSMYRWMLNELSPSALGIKTFNSITQIPNHVKKAEVWFDGDYFIFSPVASQLTASQPFNIEWFKEIIAKV